jgi:uncharacterized protein YqhQ
MNKQTKGFYVLLRNKKKKKKKQKRHMAWAPKFIDFWIFILLVALLESQRVWIADETNYQISQQGQVEGKKEKKKKERILISLQGTASLLISTNCQLNLTIFIFFQMPSIMWLIYSLKMLLLFATNTTWASFLNSMLDLNFNH